MPIITNLSKNSWFLGALVTFIGLSVSSTVWPASSKEEKVKAAIIYNLTKFIVWPEKKQALTLCIIGKGPINQELQKINKKTSKGRKISVTHSVPGSLQKHQCELLFIHNTDAQVTKVILKNLNNKPVLTISDVNRFAEEGGIIGLFRSGSRIRFAINRTSADNAHLTISSQLLNLAKIIE